MSTNSHDTPRIDLPALAGAPFAAMIRLEERIELDLTIKELVKLRASIVNGCAFCVDMHWSAARAAGESEQRLAQVAAWDESPYYDARERAALALTDAITAVGESRVPDAVWEAAREQFEEQELAHLVLQIAAINFWNRVAITTRMPPASRSAEQSA